MKEELMELIRNMVADDEMELTDTLEFVDEFWVEFHGVLQSDQSGRGTVSCEVYGQSRFRIWKQLEICLKS